MQRTLHRWLDPLLSYPNAWRAQGRLRGLPDGDYRTSADVPFVPQFATPALINDYIHHSLHGRSDPNWAAFGAPDPDTYTFWAHRNCAIACLKMAVDGFGSAAPETLWQLTEAGVALGGYIVRDAAGAFVDVGWLYEPLLALAAARGLRAEGMAYASITDLCAAVLAGHVVAAAVTPELGEPPTSPHYRIRRYDGHFVLVFGFRWVGDRATHFWMHNPSGRTGAMQAAVLIPVRRFRRAFAHRFIAFARADAPP
jgi:hypothetical protein